VGEGDFGASMEVFDPLVLFVHPPSLREPGLVIRLENFREHAEALQAAGLRE
jgi:hypothetical protein